MTEQVLKIPGLLRNGKKLAGSLRHQMAGKGRIGENRLHIEAGVRWLMRAQEKGGGGFSRRYCLYSGWDKPYIETTGYIVPTLLSAGRYLKDEQVRAGARRAADWLLGMQKENGAFCDTDTGMEQAFDTGQVLTGLIAAFREWDDRRFLDAALRAGTWLADVQEEDGSWERYAYNGIKHTYYVKVAAALLSLSEATGNSGFHEAGLRNIGWTLDHQDEDGYFQQMQFRNGEYPFLHTVAYVLEGLLDAYLIVKEEEILAAVLRTVSVLKEINRDRDQLLLSQYSENWLAINREKCVTGLAQWADVAMRTHDITGDEILLDQAIKTMYYLKSKQYSGPEPDLYGSLPGSVPLWGKYLGFCYPNWGVKFFIDALLSYERYRVPLWCEQELWVSESFRFSAAVVSEDLNAHDRKYLELIERETDTEKSLTVLDIGCGKGKFMQHFRQKFPQWTVTGVDPFFYNGKDILRGSVYSLPVADDYADVVLLIEVMQHIDHLERAMAELSRVMKTGGVLVIGDRDPLSIIGLLKPCIETAGLWMYPWDSPFQEQWRSVEEWQRIFGDNWLLTFAQSFDNPDNRIPWSNRFYLLAARKKGS